MILDHSGFLPMKTVLLYTVLMSLMTFAVYGTDKTRSKVTDPRRRKRRIPERILLLLAFAGGAFGAAAGMLFFHHKTRKRKFGVLVPLAVILWLAVLSYTIYLGAAGENTRLL